MPALFIYLIKVNVALLIFCAGYYAVLRHLTFYNLNRVYLVTAIIFSTLYPLLDVAAFLDRHEDLAKPVQVVIINWQQPVKEISKTFLGHDIWFWMLATFWAGVMLFGVRLGMQLLSLYRLHKRSQPVQIKQYMIRVIDNDINPFSFWQNIYINPKNHPERELGAILEHEQIHVKEWHTLDILLGELSAIFYWFNPGVWLMKRAIRENIEFITDQKILMKGVDRKDYQYSLLNVNMGAENSAIVNNFNMSTIKKRIMMMNAKRSSKVNITRYLFLVPAVMVLLLIFSVSKAEVKKAAKTGEKMMQAITIKLKDMVTIDEPAKPADKVDIKKKRTAKPILLTLRDSIEFRHLTQDFSFIARTDTGKKKTLDLTPLIKGALIDTNRKVFKLRVDGHDIPEVYIDGVKTENGLSSVNPERIASVSITRTDRADGKGTIQISTKPLEDVTITNLIVNDSLPLKGKVTGIRLRGVPTASSYSYTTNGNAITQVVVQGRAMPTSKVDKIVTMSGDTIFASNMRITRDKPDSALKEVVVQGFSVRSSPAKTISFKATTAFSFKDKLVIINGKESTEKELKKLSIDKVDSVFNLQGTEATRKYGDKGKNGVVIIKTKK